MISDLDWGAVLLRQLWQFSLVALVVGSITTVIGRRRPHLGYVLWLVVLVKAITPPLWMSNLSVFHKPEIAEFAAVDRNTDTLELVSGLVVAPIAEATSPRAMDTVPPHSKTNEVFTINSADLVTLWLVGAIAFSGLAVLAIWYRRRRVWRSRTDASTELLAVVDTLRCRVGIRSQVEVVVTGENFGPALLGLHRPTIVLPACLLADRSANDAEPFLMHELVHLRRGDHWIAALQSVVQVLWWFHPLVWWMNRQMSQLRERCCDQESIALLNGQPKRYADCLLDVLEAKQTLQPVYGVPGVRPRHVTTRRIQEIMTMSNQLLPRTPNWYWALAFVVAVLILPGLPGVEEPTALAQPAEAPSKAGAKTQPRRLMYGDNKPDGKKSIAGSGEMIRFELVNDTAEISAIRVHGSRYGERTAPKEDFEVTILSSDMKEVLHTEFVPYATFKRTSSQRWTTIPFKEAIELPKTFWIVLNFNAEARKGVYVSYDTSTKGEFSRVGLTDEDAKPTSFQGDWMIQVLLAKE